MPKIPMESRLAKLAQEIEAKLGVRTMRVVGDPNLRVNRVITSWSHFGTGVPLIAREDVDILVREKTREWELVEYVQDRISCGKKKAMILVGHVVSEQAGMKMCAEWLRRLVSEVAVELIAAAEPFWGPDNPVASSHING